MPRTKTTCFVCKEEGATKQIHKHLWVHEGKKNKEGCDHQCTCFTCLQKFTDNDELIEWRIVQLTKGLRRHTRCAPMSHSWSRSPWAKNSFITRDELQKEVAI